MYDKYTNLPNKKERDEIISYSVFKAKDIILPKLGLQFTHVHHVDNFNPAQIMAEDVVEIRILDYEIMRTSRTSPIDLLLK